MSEFVTVKSASRDDRVALWESNTDHPNGEAFIVGNGKTHKVALTAAVQQRLNAGVLVEVKTKIVEAVAETVTEAVEAATDAVTKPTSRKRKAD